MGRVTVTIHIDYPEGGGAAVTSSAAASPPAELDEAPWPTGAAAGPAAAPATVCPVHHLPWKTVPAGISKTTGKPYDSFVSCPERGCRERP